MKLEELAKMLPTEIKSQVFPILQPKNPVPGLSQFPGITNRENIIPVLSQEVRPAQGSVIVTDLAIFFEHSGIYAGNGRIIHRHGDGYIEAVDKNVFQERLNGLNPAFSSWVACVGDKPFRLPQAYRRAREALNLASHPEHEGYDLLCKNCHNFTRYCLTGNTNQWGLDATFASLQTLLITEFGVNCWRKCEG